MTCGLGCAPPSAGAALAAGVPAAAAGAGAVVAPALSLSGLLGAAAAGAAGLVATGLQALLGAVQAPLVGMVRDTLLRPFTLPPGVTVVWSFARDAALAALLAVFLYGVVRAMIAAAAGEAFTPPLRLLPRLLLATCGVQFSLSLVAWLLAANNAFVGAALGAAGQTALLQSLAPPPAVAAGGVAAGLVAGLLLPEVMLLVLLVALAWLTLTYVLRSAELVLLAVLAPFAAAAWILPEAAGAWRILLAHLLPAVFVQSAQVLVLWLFLQLGPWDGGAATAAGSVGAMLTSLALVFLLGRVRRLLGSLVAPGHRASGSSAEGRQWALPLGDVARAGAGIWRRAAGW